MGRRKIYADPAERQRAYRERNANRNGFRNEARDETGLFRNETGAAAVTENMSLFGPEPKSKPGRASSADVEKLCLEAYELYPRRIGRQAALAAIKRALARLPRELAGDWWEDDPIGFLANRLRLFAMSPAGKRGPYTPYPATWFNQSRYLDDFLEWYREDEGENIADLCRKAADAVGFAGIQADEHRALSSYEVFAFLVRCKQGPHAEI
ncbi:MAG: hypothetical protein WA383_21400 [Terriglobales bacterium]